MAKVDAVRTAPTGVEAEPPQDSETLYQTLKSDEMLQTADMRVQGDWTYRQLANHITAKTFVEGRETQWEQFRSTDWAARPSLVGTQGLIDVGTAADRNSSFGAGDPGIGVSCGNGYNCYGRAGSASALVVNGDTVVSASEGERAVAWNAPEGVDLAQLISQFEWGYQASAVIALLTNLPGIGNESTWKVPAYSTADGPRNFLAAYSYSYSGALFGVPAFQTTHDLNVANDTTVRFTLVDTQGDQVTSTDVDVSSGGQSVTVSWVNAPQSGYIVTDAGGTPYTIGSTDVTPPTL